MNQEDYQALLAFVEEEAEDLGEEVYTIKNEAVKNAKLAVSELEKIIEKYGMNSEYSDKATYFVTFFETYISELASSLPSSKEGVLISFVQNMMKKEE